MLASPINLHAWIEENRQLLKPPVGNKMIDNGDFIVMVVGGPNSRTDYHYDEGPEWFYQLEGEMVLKVQEDGAVRDIPIRAGEIFLLPARVPHSPRGAQAAVQEVMKQWGELAVEGHFTGPTQWLSYHRLVSAQLARVVGALPSEVVAMNTLSVNLHLMMVSFYRPTAQRPVILMEAGAFPTDRHAVEAQIRFHGFDPAECLVEVQPDEANGTISLTAIERAIAEHGPRLALVLWPGVQYRTGQAFDLDAITRAARLQGARIGFDLAHSVGNLPLRLHDVAPDFAVWCHYKYLNSGPGAVAGAFVHERHHRDTTLPRFAGWWGHEEATRFQMAPQFTPAIGAEGWQLSNPPILGLAQRIAPTLGQRQVDRAAALIVGHAWIATAFVQGDAPALA